MFSPENLKRLAARSREEDYEARRLAIAACPEIGDDGNFVIPIEVDAGQLCSNPNASAKLKLKLNVNIDAIEEAYKIRNRNDRINKMREFIQIDAPVCQIVIGKEKP